MLFNNSDTGSVAMPPKLHDVLTAAAYVHTSMGGQFNGFAKQGNLPGSSPANSSTTPSPPTPMNPSTNPLFPFIDKPVNSAANLCNKDETDGVKEKIVSALRDIIPHKSSLTLRMLVTYSTDDGKSDVIVIDETLREKIQAINPSNALDLSQKPSAVPSLFSNLLQKTAPPPVNAVPSCQAPINASSLPAPPLMPEAALLMLQTLLNNGGNQARNGFPVAPPVDIKPQLFPGEIAPNVTVTNCANILSTLPLGATTQPFPHQQPQPQQPSEGGGSRSSSPLSNSGSSLRPLHSSSSSSLNRRFMHPRRFICNQCRQQFPSLAELNRHTLEQHNAFRCNFCKAKFTQRSNLQRHSLKHVGFKPFTCNICQKEYYRKDHLVRHIEVTHPNVDPRANITTRLTSSECLDFLDNLHIYGAMDSPPEDQNATDLSQEAPSSFSIRDDSLTQMPDQPASHLTEADHELSLAGPSPPMQGADISEAASEIQDSQPMEA